MIHKSIVKKRFISTLKGDKDARRANIPTITYPVALPITSKKMTLSRPYKSIVSW